MADSWGHTLQKLSPEQLVRVAALELTSICPIRNCDQPTTHLGTYRYVTGRAGRVSYARRYMCDGHAEKFRAKHDLPQPEAAPEPRHALERIVEPEPDYGGVFDGFSVSSDADPGL